MIKFFCLLPLMFVGFFAAAQDKKKISDKKNEVDSAFKQFFADDKLQKRSLEIIQSPHLDSLVAKYRIEQLAASKKNSEANKEDFTFIVSPISLSTTDFNSLTTNEKFAYAFKYPEAYSQLCSMYFFEKYDLPFLHAYLPFRTQAISMSQRQYKSLEDSRSSSVFHINDIIKMPFFINNAYKDVIVKLNAFECIPTIMLKYDTSKIKDNYILTTGILLMKNDSFPAFINSNIYSRLYNGKGGWREKIDLTETIKKTTVDLIDKYYLWKQGK